MDELYMYYVNPWRPVIGLSIGVLNTKKIVKLSKDDVLKCLDQHAKVYRRFNGKDDMILITQDNIDRYHAASLLSDDQFKKQEIDKAAEGSKNVAVPAADPAPVKVEEPVVEETKEEVATEESVAEWIEERVPQVEEKAEEVVEEAPAEEVPVTETEEAVEEQIQEEEVSEDTNSDASVEANSVDKVIVGFDGNNNKHNKKHRKNNQ